jgi:hypothetical protein
MNTNAAALTVFVSAEMKQKLIGTENECGIDSPA